MCHLTRIASQTHTVFFEIGTVHKVKKRTLLPPLTAPADRKRTTHPDLMIRKVVSGWFMMQVIALTVVTLVFQVIFAQWRIILRTFVWKKTVSVETFIGKVQSTESNPQLVMIIFTGGTFLTNAYNEIWKIQKQNFAVLVKVYGLVLKNILTCSTEISAVVLWNPDC